MTGDSPLSVLLVEDNPGDARYIQEILREGNELSARTVDSHGAVTEPVVDDGESAGRSEGPPEVVHESRLADGLERLDDERHDVVLLDLNLPDSAGMDTLAAVLDAADTVPVVVLTGVSDREIGMDALRRGAEEYLVKDEINPDLLIRSVFHAIERNAQRHQLEQQREQLAALNQLNEIVQAITNAVIEQSTREEIESTVCELLAGTDSYEFAWIGEVDMTSQTVSVRAEAGVEGYLDGINITVDPDDERSEGPTGRALRTGEIQVTQDISTESTHDPWRDHVEQYDFRSSAAIPIVHEDTLYGVLSVYASRPHAFGGEERTVISQLGEVVGHAIAAVERKRALMSDEVIEIDFQIPDVFEEFAGPGQPGDRITIETVVPVEDGEYLLYASTTADNVETIEELVETVPHWVDGRVVGEEPGEVRFELRLSEPPVLTVVASHGGYVSEAYLEDGDYYLTVQLSHSVEVRQFIEAVQERYPEAAVRAKRQVSRTEEDTSRVLSALEEKLTDRQRSVLETAYFAGYFDWPRTSSGEDVAESLGVSAPTVSQHLRRAQNKIVEALFEDQAIE